VKIPVSDRVRIALAPIHLVVGGFLIRAWWRGPSTPMVLALGIAFIAFGGYRLAQVRRALRSRS
jgi:hypothetical protein